MAQVNSSYTAFDDKLKQVGSDSGAFSEGMDKAQAATHGLGGASESTGLSVESLNQGLEVSKKALEMMRQAYEQTIGKAMEYDDVIEQQARLGGTSAEAASRFVSVLKNWQVSADDVQTATKTLTRQGMEPSIETLKRLSGEYLNITDKQEQNAFVLKNLGKAGLEWEQVLEQGPAALQAQADAVNQNLILSDAQLEKAEELRLAQKELNDTWQGLSITIGNDAIPAMTAWVTFTDRLINNTDGLRDHIFGLGVPFHTLFDFVKGYGDVANETAAKTANLSSATDKLGASAMSAADAEKAATDAAKEMSDANVAELSTIKSIQAADDTYTQKTNANADKRKEAVDALYDLRQQGYSEYSDQVKGELAKIADLNKADQDLAAQRELDSKKRILDMLQQKLAQDGLTDNEMKGLLKQGEAWGVYSAKTVEEANKAIDAADKLASEINAIPTPKAVDINVTTHYSSTGNPPPAYGTNTDARASGGPVEAGAVYTVGEQGPETFIPSTSGTILPNGVTRLGGGASSANEGAGGSAGIVVNLTYAPAVSMQSSDEIKKFVYAAIRQLQADGLVPTRSR